MRAVAVTLLLNCCVLPGSRLVAEDTELPGDPTPSIKSRLASIKYAAIESGERLGECVVIHAFTPAQHERSLDLVKTYRANRIAHKNEMELLEKRARELARQVPRDREELENVKKVILEKHSIQFPSLRPDYLVRSRLCRVVGIGQDYIELEQSENADGTILIPFSKLAKVVFPRAEEPDE